MTSPSQPSSNGQTRLAYIIGVPLAPDCQRQWPQMEEIVRGRDLIGWVEGNFPNSPWKSAADFTSTTLLSSSGPVTTATDASIATSASPNCATVRPPKSPTIGANPPPPPTGEKQSPTA